MITNFFNVNNVLDNFLQIFKELFISLGSSLRNLHLRSLYLYN